KGMIIGTTGFDDAGKAAIAQAAQQYSVLLMIMKIKRQFTGLIYLTFFAFLVSGRFFGNNTVSKVAYE
ncbi:hypothetical protein Q4R02_13580, partial [Morganella morganii]